MATQSIIFGLIVAAAVLVRQVLGFGFSLTFVPLASFVLKSRDAVLAAIVLELVIGSLLCFEYRSRLRILEALQLKLASLLGILLGIVMLHFVSPTLLFAVCLAAAMPVTLVVLLRPGILIQKSPARLLTAGFLSGAMNTWGSFSGPPVVLYYLTTETSPQEIKGLLTGYFFLVYFATLASLTLAGEYLNFTSWRVVSGGAVVIVLSYPFFRKVATRLESRFKLLATGFLLVVSILAFIKAVL